MQDFNENLTQFTFKMKNILACLFLKLVFALSWIEIWHRKRQYKWENSFTHIHYIYKEELKKKQWICRSKKMSKATEENK